MSWTWQGRQLTKAVKDKTVTYTYDSEGIRTSKSDGTNTTKYLLNGTQILAQTTNGKTLCFFYDQQGNRVAMADSSNKFYYYIYNLQGDVIALADASTGKLAVTYTYDAWGKLVKLEDSTANSVGTLNPFRYRGYYYDTETSLYYLQSRYYDPEVGRFINADAFASTDISGVLSTNMFAYCENNPVMRSDPTGETFLSALMGAAGGAAVGAMLSMATQVIINVAHHDPITKNLGQSAAEGALSGALSAVRMNPVASVCINAAVSGINSYVSQKRDGSVNIAKVCTDAVVGGILGRRSKVANGQCKSIVTYGDRFIRQTRNAIKGGKHLEIFGAAKRYGKNIYGSYYKHQLKSSWKGPAYSFFSSFWR